MAASLPRGAAARPVDEIVELLAEAAAFARHHQREDLLPRLDAERARVLTPVCHVLVVGEFKKGKSTLVNALLNARVCPADADRATAVPTLVRYGPEAAATTGQPDGGTAAAVPLADLEWLATEDVPGGQRRSVNVTLPRRLLRDGLVIVDTPGVGGGLAAAHAATTLRALTAADVLLFVSDAGQEYGGPELDFLRRAADLCPTVICALTKIDFYPEWRRILELDTQHLRRAGLDCPIVALSAPLRHHGVRTGDRALIAESGYPWLAALLRQAAVRTADTHLTGAAAAGHSALAQLVVQLSTEHDALRDPQGRDDRVQQWVAAKERAEELKSAGSRWQQLLSDRLGDLASTVDHDLGVRLRAVRRDAADRIAAEDPSRTWGELQPWLYKRTNEAVLDHLRMIQGLADGVADEVAQQFGSAAAQVRVAVELDSSSAAARDVALAAVAADRSARLQLGLFAARGASTGAVVTHAIGLVVGLALPVTLPATALVATVLARKTWRSAQQSQLRALRSDAERAVSAYLDEVAQVASKDSRDTVRQVHRQLRDVFSQRATELYATTVQSLEAQTHTLKGDEKTRQERLSRVTVELAELRARCDHTAALVDRLLNAPDAGRGGGERS
ncbi:MAG TPA: dynamin family protein [Pilimelia sp.]|nr:dynamin family protein [Pilimelia sp.]